MNDFNQLIESCSYLLHTSPLAKNALLYLDNRISKDAQKKFNFGFFPQQEDLKVLFPFINQEKLLELNIIYSKYNVYFSTFDNHNLILPYRDVYGNIIAIVGRSLLEDEQRKIIGISKYKNTSFDKSKHLFGFFEAKKTVIEKGYIYIVEGQFDCIQAHNSNITNVVALGSSNMSMEQVILLLRYTNNVILLLDNDEAGEEGRRRIIDKYSKYMNVKNAYIPLGFKDLDEFLIEMGGSGDLENSLRLD